VETPQTGTWKKPEVVAPVFCAIIIAAIMIGFEGLNVITGQAGFFGTLFVISGALYLASAWLVLKRRRSGYIIGIVVSAIWLLLLLTSPEGFTSFADPATFLTYIITIPAFIIVIVYSVLGFRLRGKTGVELRTPRMMPTSSILAVGTLGFVIGGSLVGVLAGGIVSGLVTNSNVRADVTIVLGASNNGVAQPFSPANLTVKAGSTVTWVNKDTIAHTVTSTSVPSGVSSFDSGNILYGFSYSEKFTQPGTYHYYCSIHPSMTGTIIVTP
jgi:plastocyanin